MLLSTWFLKLVSTLPTAGPGADARQGSRFLERALRFAQFLWGGGQGPDVLFFLLFFGGGVGALLGVGVEGE